MYRQQTQTIAAVRLPMNSLITDRLDILGISCTHQFSHANALGPVLARARACVRARTSAGQRPGGRDPRAAQRCGPDSDGARLRRQAAPALRRLRRRRPQGAGLPLVFYDNAEKVQTKNLNDNTIGDKASMCG